MDNEVLRHDVGEGGGVTKRCAPLYRKTNAQQMQDFQAALSAGGLIEQISTVWKTRKYKTTASQTFANWNLAKEKKKSSTNNSCNQS
jgi:hypothetical protein